MITFDDFKKHPKRHFLSLFYHFPPPLFIIPVNVTHSKSGQTPRINLNMDPEPEKRGPFEQEVFVLAPRSSSANVPSPSPFPKISLTYNGST